MRWWSKRTSAVFFHCALLSGSRPDVFSCCGNGLLVVAAGIDLELVSDFCYLDSCISYKEVVKRMCTVKKAVTVLGKMQKALEAG